MALYLYRRIGQNLAGASLLSSSPCVISRPVCDSNYKPVYRPRVELSHWPDTSVHKIGEWADLQVLFSQSHDVQWNLALEEWISQKAVSCGRHILLFYVNSPSVVIGRMQNQWLECDMQHLVENGVVLARRRSGGGAVYHDQGNLNVSFLTPKDKYRRLANLEWTASRLHAAWPSIEVSVSNKGDMRLANGDKISGSAARVARLGAYQHFTMLVEADRNALYSSLEPTLQEELRRNSSTASRRSSVTDLRSVAGDCTISRVCDELTGSFLRDFKTSATMTTGFNAIAPPPSPDDAWKEIDALYSENQTWDWIVGRTPPFEIRHELAVHGEAVYIDLAVERGIVRQVALTSSAKEEDAELERRLTGLPLQLDRWAHLVEDAGKDTFAGVVISSLMLLFWPG